MRPAKGCREEFHATTLCGSLFILHITWGFTSFNPMLLSCDALGASVSLVELMPGRVAQWRSW